MPRLSAGYTSSGIARIRILAAVLPDFSHLTRLRGPARRVDAVIGWGLKPTARKARAHARRRSLPYLALEDGFLRSLGLGVEGFQPHSLVVDARGIYYDASRPSDLECLIAEGAFADDELARARHCMALLRRYRLSKYNHAPDRLPAGLASDRERILLVDQTWGDASIHHGGASAASFQQMLDEALEAHPQAEVLVKVHPDVIAGKKRGHLLEAARRHPRCRLIGDDLNPWALLDIVDHVHVVTSQLGFEALIAGKSVTCHGLPFYAGWGLTDDRQRCPRRNRPRRLEQLFAAAYLRYCRYGNPYTGEPDTLEGTIALIADQKRQRDRLAGAWTAGGFSRWKRGFVGNFLGPAAHLTHYAESRAALEAAPPGSRHLAWASRVDDALDEQCRQCRVTLARMEDGFIRSVGLGVDLERPLSLVIDHLGIYYDPSRPSELEGLLEEAAFPEDLLRRARALRERLVTLKLTKYNVAGGQLPGLPPGRRRILVPGQVETDASIARGSPEIRTNRALLEAVRARHPEALLLYKPHPDVVSGARLGALDETAHQLYDLDVGDSQIADLLEAVDEVHTMSSLTGFEALLRGKRVATYGLPFYAGWGLTDDQMTCARRTRRLSLDALVAATLLLYPTYVAPDSGQLCNAETAVALLEQRRSRSQAPGWKTRLYRRYRNTFIGKH
ncbi:capsular polysaccharide biosynthesis protein [Halomonas sp. BM-2019]|uniref:capsular polysaccharide biosynthesis protein n=1 Tax=Halomonas sp. BM-2019 TaxID=2811227 RepID=UPI001B3C219F|nr:MAG: capsular polysaccharide biosynthesis protein [Halomonas sp. BM-2019]